MILVDYSQVCVANYAVQSRNGQEPPELDLIRHTFLNSIRLANAKFKQQYGSLVLAVDTPNSWRKQAFPYYKAGRAAGKDASPIDWAELKKCIDIVQAELQEHSPYRVVKVDRCEADDIIGVLARKCVQDQEQCLIISGDKDFIQLQANNIFVKQWDNVHQRWIGDEDPSRYLFEHVVKGDRGDGIPNAFSADDHYVAKTARAKPIRKTSLDKWWNGEDLNELTSSPWFKRNVQLVDLRKTPAELQQAIMDKYDSQKTKNKSKMLSYLAGNGLNQLINSYGDF